MVTQQWVAEQRAAAAQWARRMHDAGFVVLDTETTGMEDDDELVQISVVDHAGEVLVDTTVRPTKTIHPRASAVHGLTAADLVDAPSMSELFAELQAALQGRTVVAYNVAFDRRMLDQTLWRYNLPALPVRGWECAMQRYAQYLGRWNARYRSFTWVKLTVACGIERIPVTAAHSALGDSLMTLSLIERMAGQAADGPDE